MHILNTAGMERFPEARFDMCRLGIGLYGVSCTEGEALRPVSRLLTRIVRWKELAQSGDGGVWPQRKARARFAAGNHSDRVCGRT